MSNRLDRLLRQLERGEITRREFINLALALGISASSISSLASAAAATAKAAKNELIIAAPTTPPGIDGEFFFGHEVYDHIWNLNSGLTRWKRKPAEERGGWDIEWQAEKFQEITEPRMARTWEVSNDGKVYTFHLRRGWLSHYGNEFTADDVKWHFDRAFALNSGGRFFNRIQHIASKDDVKVLDRYTVQFQIEIPTPDFLLVMSTFWQPMLDSKEARKHATSDDPWANKWLKTHAGGFGSYKLESLVPGKEVVWVAQPGHPFPAKINRVVFKEIPSSAVRTALLAKGDVDVAQFVTPRELETLRRTKGVRVWSFRGYTILQTPLNQNFPPLDNRKVRQALSYAVPYEAIVKEVYRGFARPAYGPLSDHAGGFDASLFYYKTDYEKAKKLLEEAGYGNGFKTRFTYSIADPIGELVAVQLRSSFAKIGVTLELNAMPPGLYTEVLFKGAEPMIYFSLGADSPDPNYAMSVFYASFGNNYAHNKIKEFDDLVNEGAAIQDWKNRIEFHKKAVKLIIDDATWLWMAQPGFHVATRENVTGINWYAGESVDWSFVDFA